MSELVDKLRAEFQDEEYRRAYADECLDTMIATQIKVLREQRGMTQGELAVAAGMKQPRIPLLEDATYSNWSINTLKRFAKAFDVALSVKFETFSRVVSDLENLSRESLQRPTFANDPQFQRRRSTPFHRFRRRRRFQARRQVLQVPLSVQVGVTQAGAASNAEAETNLLAGKKKEPARAEELGGSYFTAIAGAGLGESR